MPKNINFKHTNSAEEPFQHDMVKTHENQVKWNTSQDEDNTVQRSFPASRGLSRRGKIETSAGFRRVV